MKRLYIAAYAILIAAVHQISPAFATDDGIKEFYGTSGAFTIVFNKYNACVAFKKARYEDIDGNKYQVVFLFGLLKLNNELYSMIGLRSPSFSMEKSDSRRGTVDFDDKTFEALYVADNEQLLTAYMDPVRIRDIMRSHEVKMNLFDGTFIEVPLGGTFDAGQIVGDCFEDQFTKARKKHDPLSK